MARMPHMKIRFGPKNNIQMENNARNSKHEAKQMDKLYL